MPLLSVGRRCTARTALVALCCIAATTLWFVLHGQGVASTSKTSPLVPLVPLPLPVTPKNDGAGDRKFIVSCNTTKGPFLVEVNEQWAPIGAAHFRSLVENGFYNGAGFFRVVPSFMVQFGISADPSVASALKGSIADDPVVASNTRGFVTYAQTSAPNSRSTQIFINYNDNSFLDRQRFAPFGKVLGSGMEQVVSKINAEYGESPDQGQIQAKGSDYLRKTFPRLDYINTCVILRNL